MVSLRQFHFFPPGCVYLNLESEDLFRRKIHFVFVVDKTSDQVAFGRENQKHGIKETVNILYVIEFLEVNNCFDILHFLRIIIIMMY